MGADGHRAGGDGQPRARSLAFGPVVVGAGGLADNQCADQKRKAEETVCRASLLATRPFGSRFFRWFRLGPCGLRDA